jgi:hypothetical protein
MNDAQKAFEQWIEITGLKVGDKVLVVAPYPDWAVKEWHVGRICTVADTHYAHRADYSPPMSVLLSDLFESTYEDVEGCIPFWCLVKVEDKND